MLKCVKRLQEIENVKYAPLPQNFVENIAHDSCTPTSRLIYYVLLPRPTEDKSSLYFLALSKSNPDCKDIYFHPPRVLL
jgi:hypothetical protein